MLESLILGIVLVSGFMTLVGLFFWHVPSWGGTFYLLWTHLEISPIFIYTLIMSIFSSVALFAIVIAVILVKHGLKRMDLKFSDLKTYHEIHILTEKRWIQKDFRSLLYYERNKVPAEIISPSGDIVLIKLTDIEKATVSKIRTNYNIAFHFKRSLNQIQYPAFLVKFKLKDYMIIKKLLSQIIPIQILKE